MKGLLQADPALLDSAMEREFRAFTRLGTDPASAASIREYFAWTKTGGEKTNE
jgi:hypothetical protein